MRPSYLSACDLFHRSGTAPLYTAVASTGRDKDLYLIAVHEEKDNAGHYVAQLYEIDTYTSALATRLKSQHVLVCSRPVGSPNMTRDIAECSALLLRLVRATFSQSLWTP